ncbi:MAG: M23 family metallopeptidase [Candidatus Krumholzibacteria bacterium]|jgi:hypothetical protein|nr:M23 family metallopeptidase [Candidatus Krumholzibacteria bacterium]
MDRYYTFLYVRRGNAGVKSIRIRRSLVIGAASLLLALIITSISMITRFSGLALETHRLADMQDENSELKKRLSTFRTEVEELKGRMEINLELQNKAMLMANLDPISEDVWQVGIGGPEPLIVERELRETDVIFSKIEKDLDRILRQSKLQKDSYTELLAILEKEIEIRECTPSIKPLRGGFISSRFGRRMDPYTGRISFHKGVDFFARAGTPVISTADGTVTMAREDGGMGLMVEISHGNGFETRYAHLSGILVKRGQDVRRGETIGLVGNTGRSTGPHLHYEVAFRNSLRNPLEYIIPEDVFYD